MDKEPKDNASDTTESRFTVEREGFSISTLSDARLTGWDAIEFYDDAGNRRWGRAREVFGVDLRLVVRDEGGARWLLQVPIHHAADQEKYAEVWRRLGGEMAELVWENGDAFRGK